MKNNFGPPIEGIEEAKTVVYSGIVLLVVLAIIYLILHSVFQDYSYNKKDAGAFFQKLGAAKAAVMTTTPSTADIKQTLKDLQTLEDSVLTKEFTEKISLLNGYTHKFENGTTNLDSNDQRLTKIKTELDSIEKMALSLSRNDNFFWVVGPLRWLEVVFWGEFGVIIGILVWVCTQLKSNEYSRATYTREKLWYLTEIAIGPVVVIAVFFILKVLLESLTGSPYSQEDIRGSIHITLGVSFALGLYIRRSLGIFNFIKDKLPNPDKKKTKP